MFCTGCAGSDCVDLGCELCALCEGYCSAGQNLSILNGSRVSTAWRAVKIRMEKIAYMHGGYRQIYSAVDNKQMATVRLGCGRTTIYPQHKKQRGTKCHTRPEIMRFSDMT